MAAATEKVLLDTDIGSDIDDAICLAYLLAQPRCELLGITTVTGEAAARAAMASALCQAAGKAIPIYPGTEIPLIIAQKQPTAPQAAALPRWPHAVDFPRGEAVEFLRRTIRQHLGEVTLLGIGPLTNIALLFRADAEIPALLKGLVLMGGAFTADLPAEWKSGRLEWNARLDPHATDIVYRAARGMRRHRSVGLDVTLKVSMDRDEARAHFGRIAALHPVLDFAEVWFQERPRLFFHDPMAALTIFDDGVCDFQRGNVAIELADPARLGRTDFVPDPGGAHEVAVAVNADRCVAEYFRVFGPARGALSA